MVLSGLQVLRNILSTEELQRTPKSAQNKLGKYLDDFFVEYYKYKAAANRLRDYKLKADALQGQIEDYELKLQNYNHDVSELRTQLDAVSNERKKLLDTTSSYEIELTSLRNDKKAACDERDQLLKVNERQNSELERLQQDLITYQQQLEAAITAKCEALAKVDDQYGELKATFEATQLQHEQNIEEKNKIIESLKEEMGHANDLLKELQNGSVESAISLDNQRDELLSREPDMEELLEDAHAKLSHMERENEELSRQVCYLLKEIEQLEASEALQQEIYENYEEKMENKFRSMQDTCYILFDVRPDE